MVREKPPSAVLDKVDWVSHCYIACVTSGSFETVDTGKKLKCGTKVKSHCWVYPLESHQSFLNGTVGSDENGHSASQDIWGVYWRATPHENLKKTGIMLDLYYNLYLALSVKKGK